MNVSLYQAAAAMNVHARWQDMIAENLSASNVPGFRKHDLSFAAVEAGLPVNLSGGNPGRYVVPDAHTSINFEQGQLRATGASLDCALQGQGFFEVQLPDGSHGFTRDGEFQLDSSGQLVTKQGYSVLGEGGPLQFDPANPSPVSISATGDVSQGSDVKGKLKLVEFADTKQLTAGAEGVFLAGSGQPTPSTTTTVHQGFLEAANTSPITEMTSLITAMRMFEANQRVLSLQDERMGKIITELANPN